MKHWLRTMRDRLVYLWNYNPYDAETQVRPGDVPPDAMTAAAWEKQDTERLHKKLDVITAENSKIRETFEIVSAPDDDDWVPQYFVLSGMEGEIVFKPETIFGVTSDQELAHIVSRYRQTGVLVRPAPPWTRFRSGSAFEVAGQPEFVYILRKEALMVKISKYERVTT